jgi:acyl-CoA synthetase (AMP-forming)/AMP-acid ligase II
MDQLNIANGVREFAVASPSAVAVVDDATPVGKQTLTYAQLDERASRLANALAAAGLVPGDRVGVLLGNRLEYPEIAAGLAKGGFVMVPVNPRLTGAEASYILGHAGARALVADDALTAVGQPGVHEHGIAIVLSIDGTTLGTDYEAALAAADPVDPRVEVAETDPFCIAYTSGTTGKPKGVMISHRSRVLTFYGTALEWGLGPGRRTIAVAPMYHGAGFAFAYAAVVTGGTVAMLRAWDPARFLAMVQEFQPHSVFLVPAHAHMLRALGDDVIGAHDTSSLETVYFNAAPLPQALKLWFLDAFPHVAAHELYGSTEAGIVSNLRPPDMRRKEMCVGPPWFMTEVRLVAPDGSIVTGPGEGELYSRSPYLMNGYLDDPEATAACTTDDGFLTSGDIARRDEDGYLYIIDRVKDLIITGGSNVYPREVEEVVATHPSIAEVAVVGLPDEQWGEAVTACVVPAAGATIDQAALDAHARQHLAGYKVPKRWVAMEALPRNAAMKILKRDLRDRLKEST